MNIQAGYQKFNKFLKIFIKKIFQIIKLNKEEVRPF